MDPVDDGECHPLIIGPGGVQPGTSVADPEGRHYTRSAQTR